METAVATNKKKPEEEALSLPVELSLSFLAAGELAPLARVNKSYRRAAFTSLLSRRRHTYDDEEESKSINNESPKSKKTKLESTLTFTIPSISTLPIQDLPKHLNPRNPYANLQHNWHEAKILEESNNNHSTLWKLQWKTAPSLYLKTKRANLQIPTELVADNKLPFIKVVHVSLQDEILLVVVVHKFRWMFDSNSDSEEEEEEAIYDVDEFMDYDEAGDYFGKQLYGILYHVSDDHHGDDNDKDNIITFQPLSTQTLLDSPVTSHWSCSSDNVGNDNVGFAETIRSKNVFCCLTAIPNCETPDVDLTYYPQPPPGKNLTYSLFDIIVETPNPHGGDNDDDDNHDKTASALSTTAATTTTLTATTRPRGPPGSNRMVIYRFRGDDYAHLMPSITGSHGGPYFSVMNTGAYEDGGGWFVFDVSSSAEMAEGVPLVPVVDVGGCQYLGGRHLQFAFYTPDGDFVMHWGVQAAINRLIEELEPQKKAIPSGQFPFAKKLILVVEP